MASLISIGLSGLRATQTALTVTGHNITNVNTPGYTRQDLLQRTGNPLQEGTNWIGTGSQAVDVRRLASDYLTAEVRSNTMVSSDIAAYKGQIDQLDSLLSGTVTGITPSLQSFFSAMQASVESPSDVPARQLVLSEAEGLANRFNSVYDRLDDQNQFLNKQMSSIADQVNNLAVSISQYNDRITQIKPSGQSPNDLLDARDEAIRQLSELVGVQVVEQDATSLNVFIGSGQPLVVGSRANSIAVTPSPSDPMRMQVEFSSGSVTQPITSQISGGELGGLLRYRSQVLDPTFNSLGRMAMAISEQVNDQLSQGLDLKGNVGSALFKDINSADLQAQRSYPNGVNVYIDDSSKLTTSDYEVEFLSSGTNATYRIRPVGGSWVQSSPGSTTFTVGAEDVAGLGFHIPVNGTSYQAGDTYTLMPTRTGARDVGQELNQPEQLAFTAPVRSSSNLQNRGNGSIGQPDLVDGPTPINKADLESLLGSNGLTLSFSEPDQLSITGGTAQFELGTTPATYASTITVTPGQSNTLKLGNGDYSFELKFSGVPETGDTFNLSMNTNGVSDNRNGLKLVDLQSKATIGVSYDAAGQPVTNSGVSFNGGYGDLVERVGSLTSQTRVDSNSISALLKQAQDNRDSLAGVNLDEEAAKLIQFEQYYSASAQVIQVARSVFDTLYNSLR
ncbi:flagellar hook-associated protein 1 FlgK [Pseudomonas duriflava]|uniref:Flagellar hook-associated protein 1 n=1 Tax=Pseudomonas duriflava TaxID=459528 RepID=A0A562Q9Y2_9PSED|nr:flagellar hook-associated protein FlgK [Pseudomonas duriflava]TWI53571.1 flagellar hook-associated protein 1 FlgK [Pseudomonas duriflava]